MALQLRRGETRSFGKVVAASFIVMAFVLQPLLSRNVPSAFAAGAINISTVAGLRDAIEHQAPGQVWNIHAGNYGLSAFNDITAQGQTGWYFPITANDITINGIGNPTIYGTGFSANGNWSTQNLVTVFGNNVSISGLTLMPKVEPNKTIEVLGNDFTLKNSTITPNTLTDQAEYGSIANPQDRSDEKNWSGSIYFNNATGTANLKNITVNNGGISVHAPNLAINASNVKLNYSTDVDWINGYRFHVASPSTVINGKPKYTYHVNSALNNLDSVLKGIGSVNTIGSDTISLDSDMTLVKQATITKPVVVNGNGYTVSPSFIKTDNDNNSAIGIQSNNVTVNDLTEEGDSGINLHGINVFGVKAVVLNDVTVKDNDYSGLNVNASKVTVTDLSTAHNGWDGVDVDKTGAVLTVKGTSHHDETTPSIYVDKTTVGKVVDINNQYDFVNNVKQSGDRAYSLKLSAPTTPYPGDAALINTNDFWFSWSAVLGATGYEWQGSQSNAVDANGNLSNVAWTGDYHGVQPTGPTEHSVGASGTWYWQVRAVGANGAKSPWSTVWSVTIDTTAPAAPSDLTWIGSNNQGTQGGYTNIQKGTLSWKDTTVSDVDHYVYKFWTNIPGYQDNPSNPWHDSYTYVVKTSDGGYVPTDFADKEGTYYFCVEAVDAAGNTSACTQSVVVYDKTTPTVSGVTVDHSSTNLNQLTVAGTVNDANLKNYNLRVYNADHSAQVSVGPWTGFTGAGNVDNGALGTLNISGLPDGNYWVRIWADDLAGNRTGISSQIFVPFIVDRTAPNIKITNFTRNSDGTYTVSGTSDDSSDVTVAIDNQTPLTATPAGGVWSVKSGVLVDGKHTVTAMSADATGNAATDSEGYTTSSGNTTVAKFAGVIAAALPVQFAATVPFTTGAPVNPVTNDQSVLGDQTTTRSKGETSSSSDNKNDEAVKGASTTRDQNSIPSFVGLAWYWWLGVLTAGFGLWWLLAARRHKDAE